MKEMSEVAYTWMMLANAWEQVHLVVCPPDDSSTVSSLGGITHVSTIDVAAPYYLLFPFLRSC
jgi:hypothetical protein